MRITRILCSIGVAAALVLSAEGFEIYQNSPNGDATLLLVGLYVFALSLAFLVFDVEKEKKRKIREVQLEAQKAKEEAALARMNEVSSLTVLPVIDSPASIILRPQETCHFQAGAALREVKSEVVGRSGGHAGYSVRIAKGLTVHTGSSRGRVIREDRERLYPGILSVTSERIIMTGDRGFERPLKSLTSWTAYNGTEGITLQFGRSLYTILTEEPCWIPKILQLMKERSAAEARKPAPPTSNSLGFLIEKETHPALNNFQEECDLTPQNAELSYLDAQALKFWSKKKTDFVIPAYYSNSAFGKNLKPALERLLDGGYLSLGDLRQRISICTVPELKAVLDDRELKVSGNKSDLVSRILANFDEDEIEDRFPVNVYRITEKGTQALAVYSILEDNDAHSLNLSYYRLMKERESHPSEENNVILTRLLSEDVQECYKTQDRSRFLRVIDTTARFMHEIGEDESSFECYALSFFVWASGEIKTPFPESLNDVIRLTARLIDREGKLCGYDLTKMLDTFRAVVVQTDPFCLASQENVGMAVNLLRESLSIK